MERDFKPFLDEWEKYLKSLSNEELFGMIGLTVEEAIELVNQTKEEEETIS